MQTQTQTQTQPSPTSESAVERRRLQVERRLGDWMRARLPAVLVEFVMFGLKQAWACLFGGLTLALLIGTSLVWSDDWGLARYDFLVLATVALQAGFLLARLETSAEARVILLFHLTGTVMEVFKLHVGSWDYPEPGLLKLGGVPLFSGFMYASVGSYIARVIRIFDMRFTAAPSLWALGALATAIYLNFFTHHVIVDLRWVLVGASLVLVRRTRVWFTVSDRERWLPLAAAAVAATVFLFAAENVGTLTGTWVYGGEGGAHWAGWSKVGSWYLLLWVSFAQVLLVFRHVLHRDDAISSTSTTGRGSARRAG
ncbi:MAG: DUF817 domain-containing protein [Actinomycetota bacterium]